MKISRFAIAGVFVLGAITHSLQSNSQLAGSQQSSVLCFHHDRPFGVRESHAACVIEFEFNNPGYGSKSDHSVQDCITSTFFDPYN